MNVPSAGLRTARLRLRSWQAADLAAFAEMSVDPSVMEFRSPLPDREAVRAWAARLRAHWRRHGFARWVVYRLHRPSLVA